MAVAAQDLSSWDKDPRLFLFTSLTSGSSQIFTATSRMELILRVNKIPFQAIDVATDDQARKLWGRRAGKRKLPGLVKEGFVIGDINDVEDWNEFGELKEAIGPVPGAGAAPATNKQSSASVETPAAESASKNAAPPADDPMRDLAAQAANIGLSRQKGPKALVDESKIRPLEGSGTAEPEPETKAATKETKPDAGTLETKPDTGITETKPDAGTTETKPEVGTTEAKSEAAIPEAGSSAAKDDLASSSAASATEPPEPKDVKAHHEPKNTNIDTAAVGEYVPGDPTDGVPSAGTPITATGPGISSEATPNATPATQSSDSLAGGQGLADAADESSAAKSSPSLASSSHSDRLSKIASISSASSLPEAAMQRHRGSNVRLASQEEIREVEDRERIDEGDETEEDGGDAADASKAGDSVKD